MKKTLLTFILISLISVLLAEDTQLIRGRITAASSGKPIAEAIVTIYNSETFSTSTDSSGYFEKQISIGTYSVMVTAAGYKAQQRNNIVVLAGKQQLQDFELDEYKIELDSVQVTSNTVRENVSLDLWNIQRFAAVFYDPARVTNTHAAIVNNDDQANNICVRGTSPNYVQWKLEGVEVVNPNHLENAGTINDRPTLNGGGVSLFSAQLLQNSGFLMSPFDATQGNSLSGIFDMKLRNGNNQKFERIIQASLLGLDVSVEGPLSKKGKSSFLVNYRYSTIGLLSKMGIDFGGEKTNFQDLSFVFNLPFNNGSLRIFSMTGKSETIFRGVKDSASALIQKDLENIDYHSFTTINGLNYIHTFSNTLFMRTIIAYSAKNVDRTSVPTEISWLNQPVNKDQYKQSRLSGVTYFSKRLNNQYRFKSGIYYNYFINEQRLVLNDISNANGRLTEPLFQPFIAFEGTFFNKLEMKAGLHGVYQARTNDFSLQPRLLLQYTLSARQDISFNYGQSSQLQPFFLNLGNVENYNLRSTKSDAFSFIHHIKALSLDLRSELYYHLYHRIPVSIEHNFSAFNYFNEQVLFPLDETGEATVYGYDLTVEKNMNKYYIILSASIYNSSYTIAEKTFEGRFNTNYNCALTTGREFHFSKNRTLGTDLRGFVRNGFKEQSVLGSDQYLYDRELPAYSRVDLRISYRKDKTKSSVIWALDIQNLLNEKNIAYHYYDKVTQKVEPRYQLGLIPVISYKIFF
ncbi:MAG: TonB-dependent receptor plug [Bacteroidota bacterium]|jgi:hypothetical protein|nr:TonB-dependent receptor plug [Bacteroidota bacterium]